MGGERGSGGSGGGGNGAAQKSLFALAGARLVLRALLTCVLLVVVLLPVLPLPLSPPPPPRPPLSPRLPLKNTSAAAAAASSAFAASSRHPSASCDEWVTHSWPFVSTDFYRELASVTLDAPADIDALVRGAGGRRALTPGARIFLDKRLVERFARDVLPRIANPFVLISAGNSALLAPFEQSSREAALQPHSTAILSSPLLLGWFATHVALEHDKLIPLPLGNKWQWGSAKHHAESKALLRAILQKWATAPREGLRRMAANASETSGRDVPLLAHAVFDPRTSAAAKYERFVNVRERVARVLSRNFSPLNLGCGHDGSAALHGGGCDSGATRRPRCLADHVRACIPRSVRAAAAAAAAAPDGAAAAALARFMCAPPQAEPALSLMRAAAAETRSPENVAATAAGLRFEDYLVDLGRFRFCISPPGRGVDAHRTWEALMMGVVPVVQNSPMRRAYADLPVIVVRDWDEVDPDMLLRRWRRDVQPRAAQWNFDKLYAPYWKRRIEALAGSAAAPGG